MELVAEGKDELMEEYFEKGTIPEEHLITALHEAIREDKIFPVLFASGLGNIATDHLLDFIKVYLPSPTERAPMAVKSDLKAVTTNGDAAVEAGAGISFRKVDDKEPLALVCLQNHDRSLCRAHQLLQGYQRRGEDRCNGGELHASRAGASAAPQRDAGTQGG